MGKITQIHQISSLKNFLSPEPCDNFQKVVKNIEGFSFFLSAYLLCSQIIFWMIITLATSQNP